MIHHLICILLLPSAYAFTIPRVLSPMRSIHRAVTTISQEELDLAKQLEVFLETEPLQAVRASGSAEAKGFKTAGSVTERDGGLAVNASEEMNYEYLFGSVFDEDSLAKEYAPYGRVLVITDNNVDGLYGAKLRDYFEKRGILVEVAAFDINENTKTMRMLESMIDAMVDFKLNRQEPVLLMGGGLVTDVAGFACSQMRRNTPYNRIPTSLIGFIDASIAIKVAVNHGDGKNKLGAYHAHSKVFLDNSLLATLPAKELRVGMAELVKISVVEEERLFELLEMHGPALIETKFGQVNTEDSSYSAEQMKIIREVGEEVIYRGIHRMLEIESGNLKEYNLDRAIAFGHTWSPELELIAKYTYGKLIMHGQAVAMDMALSMTLAQRRGLVSEEDRDRVHAVISSFGLMLDHPVQHDSDNMRAASEEITKTRNGLLRAAVPIGKLGQCTFLNDVSHEELMDAVQAHTELVSERYPRGGLGEDFWVESPKALGTDRFIVTPSDRVEEALDAATHGRTYKEVQAGVDAARHIITGIDRMASKYSSPPSEMLQRVSAGTAGTNSKWQDLHSAGETQMLMEAEMISGQAEAQLLKVLVQFGKVRSALDLGTFTGYSALALAEALPADGDVVTVERESSVAELARAAFAEAGSVGSKIDSRVGDCAKVLNDLAESGRSFDLVFLDADKPSYKKYYELLMDHDLLKHGGMLVVDNSMYKGEELVAGGELSANGQGIKNVNEAILDDSRVEKVMLPLRDGVTLVYRK